MTRLFFIQENEDLNGWDILIKNVVGEKNKKIATFYDREAAVAFVNLLSLEK